MMRSFIHLLSLVLLLAFQTVDASSSSPSSPSHTSNYAVIVSSSRYWFNYRHVVNALTIYQILLTHGYDDDHIILMIADEYVISPRNPFVNKILHKGQHGPSLLQQQHSTSANDWIEIDYRGEDVTVENLRRALTGRSSSTTTTATTGTAGAGATTSLPVLQSNAQSNVLIYLTGHGGDSFFKFQDVEEIMALEIAHLIAQMHQSNMYHNLLLIADTCQAFTLADSIDNSTTSTTPNVTVVASSLRGESSYAHHSDPDLGLAIIERYTHAMSQYIHNKDLHTLTIEQGMVEPYHFTQQNAHIGYKTTTTTTKESSSSSPLLFMSDFFVNVETSSSKNYNQGRNRTTTTTFHFTPRLLYPLQQHEGQQETTTTSSNSRRTTEKDDTKDLLTTNNNNLLFFGSSSLQHPVFSLEEMPLSSSLQEDYYDTWLNLQDKDGNSVNRKHEKDNHEQQHVSLLQFLLQLLLSSSTSTPPPIVVLGLTTLLLSGLVFLGRVMERYLLL